MELAGTCLVSDNEHLRNYWRDQLQFEGKFGQHICGNFLSAKELRKKTTTQQRYYIVLVGGTPAEILSWIGWNCIAWHIRIGPVSANSDAAGVGILKDHLIELPHELLDQLDKRHILEVGTEGEHPVSLKEAFTTLGFAFESSSRTKDVTEFICEGEISQWDDLVLFLEKSRRTGHQLDFLLRRKKRLISVRVVSNERISNTSDALTFLFTPNVDFVPFHRSVLVVYDAPSETEHVVTDRVRDERSGKVFNIKRVTCRIGSAPPKYATAWIAELADSAAIPNESNRSDVFRGAIIPRVRP